MRPPCPERDMALTAAEQQRKQLTRLVSTSCISPSLPVLATGDMAKPPAIWIDAHRSGTSPYNQLDLFVLTVVKALSFARVAPRHMAHGASADKRANDRGPERAGAARHHHMPVPIVHHPDLDRFAASGHGITRAN